MICRVCNQEKGNGTSHYFTEQVKDTSTGKTRFIDHTICQPCDKDLRRRITAVINEVMPRAMRQTMLHSIS